MRSLTRRRRGRQLAWLKSHRGAVEHPAGSNTDQGGPIARAQLALGAWLRPSSNRGTAWCGTWAAAALRHGGVPGVGFRQAAVSLIEEDAKAGRRPFKRWVPAADALRYRKRRTLRGALAVLFGPGVHVETVRRVYPRLGLVRTDGGNTTSGDGGNQANGGGAFPRWRRLRDVRGFAIPDYSNR